MSSSGTPRNAVLHSKPEGSNTVSLSRRQMVIGGVAAFMGIAATVVWWRWSRTGPSEENQVNRDRSTQRISSSPIRSRPNSTQRSRPNSTHRSRPSSTLSSAPSCTSVTSSTAKSQVRNSENVRSEHAPSMQVKTGQERCNLQSR